jgi:hypothetical protein
VDFGVHEDVVVEDDSFEGNEKHVGHVLYQGPFGGVSSLATVFAQTVGNNLTVVHGLQGRVEIVLANNFDTVGEESLLSLTFLFAGSTDHLCDLGALEDFLE